MFTEICSERVNENQTKEFRGYMETDTLNIISHDIISIVLNHFHIHIAQHWYYNLGITTIS